MVNSGVAARMMLEQREQQLMTTVASKFAAWQKDGLLAALGYFQWGWTRSGERTVSIGCASVAQAPESIPNDLGGRQARRPPTEWLVAAS
jgi:hypothetical protein